MTQTKLAQESRALATKTKQTIELCAEDVGLCKNQLRDFIKENKERFSEKHIATLLDMLDSLDLIEDRLNNANEDLSDILFDSDD